MYFKNELKYSKRSDHENDVIPLFKSLQKLSGRTLLSYRIFTSVQGGGRCLPGNPWYSPPASVTSRLASVTFKMASKVFIEETDKNFDFITEILFRFLGFGDFKVSMVIEN